MSLVRFAVRIVPLWLPLLALPALPEWRAGTGRADITPAEPVPMWGYGDRHADLSTGTLDPLEATAIVLAAGEEKLAIVGLDLGLSLIHI